MNTLSFYKEKEKKIEFALFRLIFTKLNEERINHLTIPQKQHLFKQLSSSIRLINKKFPNIRLNPSKITTLTAPYLKKLTSSKRKALSFFRIELERLYPKENILVLGVPEENKCFLPYHWPINSNRETYEKHSLLLCKQQNNCLNLHWECEKNWHLPFLHKHDLDLTTWPYGISHVETVLPDSEVNAEDDFYDLDFKLSYFFKSYVNISQKPSYYLKQGLNPNKPRILFDYLEDERLRKNRIIINALYYQKKSLENLLTTREPIEILRNTLTRKRNRLKIQLKKIAWGKKEKRSALKEKIRNLNLLLKNL